MDIGNILVGLAALGTLWLQWRNKQAIEQVHLATNGMKKELVEEVRAASLAKGRLEGAEDRKAGQ